MLIPIMEPKMSKPPAIIDIFNGSENRIKPSRAANTMREEEIIEPVRAFWFYNLWLIMSVPLPQMLLKPAGEISEYHGA